MAGATVTDPTLRRMRATAREVLAAAGGDPHALHSAAWREPVSLARRGRASGFLVGCSCGVMLAVAATEENVAALRNVPEGRPS